MNDHQSLGTSLMTLRRMMIHGPMALLGLVTVVRLTQCWQLDFESTLSYDNSRTCTQAGNKAISLGLLKSVGCTTEGCAIVTPLL